MSDTMMSMELKKVDRLTPDQLMEEDLIQFGDSIVEVVAVESDSTGDIYFVQYEDDFGDKDVAEFKYDELIKLYVYVEEEE